MDHTTQYEEVPPPPVQKPRNPSLFILEDTVLGLVIGFLPLLASILITAFLSVVIVSTIHNGNILLLILTLFIWIFWACVGISLVLMLINTFKKRWILFISSMSALLVSLTIIYIFTHFMQIPFLPWLQPLSLSNKPTQITEQRGQAITDDSSGLSLTYLSTHKIIQSGDPSVFVIVHVRITNVSPDITTAVSPLAFFVKDANHSIGGNDPKDLVPSYHGNSLFSPKNDPLSPRTTIEGDVAFLCSPDKLPDHFGWNPNFDSSQQGVKVYTWDLTFQ